MRTLSKLGSVRMVFTMGKESTQVKIRNPQDLLQGKHVSASLFASLLDKVGKSMAVSV